MLAFVIKALLMSTFPFYRTEFPTQYFAHQYEYYEYKAGKYSEKQTIKEDSPLYRKLKALIESEAKGWRYDLVTYTPGRVFDSDKIRINCIHDKFLVVNYYDTDTSRIQISKLLTNKSCPNPNAK